MIRGRLRRKNESGSDAVNRIPENYNLESGVIATTSSNKR